MIYRPMRPGEEAVVVDLVLNVFSEFVAPRYSEEGVTEFKKFVTADALAKRVRAGDIVLLALSGRRIIGMIEVSENHHIALLFVQKSHQRRGIGGKLIRMSTEMCLQRQPDIRSITVNSSPNAFAAYQQLGFEAEENEKVVNGIRFIPLALAL